jgi:circadian clock protein KaiC
MTDRLASGSARLDAVLGGGVPMNGINLVMGRPGTGKTILAQQYIFHNATDERPALYLSTVSEPMEKMLRYGQSLTFFDTAAVGSRVIYDDLGQRLNDEGLSGVLSQLVELLRQRRPSLMVIDSFKALRAFAPDDASFRRFLHDLAGHLSAIQTTSFWVGEYDSAEVTEAPEFAVVGRDHLARHRTRSRSGSPASSRSSSCEAAGSSQANTPIESPRVVSQSSRGWRIT